MSNQPEALRLADALESGTYLLSRERDATAAELRRQHAEIERLKVEREALRAELREATEAVDDPAVNNLRTLPEAIRMLQERAKRAEAERDALRSLLTTAGLASAQEEHNKVRAERDAFRADAERYRWLREQYWIEGEGRERLGLMPATANHAADVAEFDAAIDAKLKETK
jgi:hypothetical protein